MKHKDKFDQEIMYFLGQTLPFHQTNQLDGVFIANLAFIMDENQQPRSWTTNPADVTILTNIAWQLGLIQNIQKTDKGLTFRKFPGIKPIVHRERTHTDD